MTLNPSREVAGSVTDPDVLRYGWLPIDLDPVRVGRSQKEPATDEEKATAEAAAAKVEMQLRMRGWALRP